MRHTTFIILLFLWALNLHVHAVELPNRAGQVFQSNQPQTATPNSNGAYTPFSSGSNRPILKAIDPGDIGDDIDKTNGTDPEANVNDNNTPVSDGTLLLMFFLTGYIVVFTLKNQQKLTKK